jgi:pyridoxamine 5'-phosphate oxidase
MEDMRHEYSASLDESTVSSVAPLDLLRTWINEAAGAEVADPNAMCLATIGADGAPRARMVLCKGVEEASVIFFTNMTSDKAEHLLVRPEVASTFWWPDAERSVRLVGHATALGRDEVERYFATRPRSSQVGAWVSDQSAPIADRSALEAKHLDVQAHFASGEVPCPPHWGGFRIHVHEVEYWAGRPARLHDRLRLRPGASEWSMERLQP